MLLSGDDTSGIRVMQVVAPAGVDLSGLGIEVTVGAAEGLPFEGVLRLALPRPGFTPCTWLTTVSRDDLMERAAVLSSAKLSEIDDALRRAEQPQDPTPATAWAIPGEMTDAGHLLGAPSTFATSTGLTCPTARA